MEFIDILNNSRKEHVMGLSEIQEVIMFLDRNMDGEVMGTKYTGPGVMEVKKCVYLLIIFISFNFLLYQSSLWRMLFQANL